MDSEINVSQKSGIREMIETIKEIFFGRKLDIGEDYINERLQLIYKEEREDGGTDYISKLEKDVQKHDDKVGKKKIIKTELSTEKIETNSKSINLGNEEKMIGEEERSE